MCGIVGFAGFTSKDYDRVAKEMLIIDSLRGTDSTGFFVDFKDEDHVHKTVGDPYPMVESKTWNRIWMTPCPNVFIGHNRYSTIGKSSRENAHPFEVGNIVGVHNGTINNKYALEGGQQVNVDSIALYNHINVKGLQDAVNTANGAYSLVWWDRDERRIHFLRNKERPMFIAFSKGDNVLFWASEPWMIEAIAYRNNIQLSTAPYLTEEDNHFSYKVAENGRLSDFEEEECKRVVAPTTTFFPVGNRNVGAASTGSNSTPLFRRIPNCSLDGQFVKLHACHTQVDQHGAKYLSCVPLHGQGVATDKVFRIYMTPRDNLDEHVGKKFVGKVIDFFSIDGQTETVLGYYKIEYSSLRLLKTVEDIAAEKTEENKKEEGGVEDASAPTFRDGEGRYIIRAAWKRKYQDGCCWCCSAVDPEDEHHFTKNGDLVCGSCQGDLEQAGFTFKS